MNDDKRPYRPWQWRKANREVERLRRALSSQVRRGIALHTRVGIAEGWVMPTPDAVRDVQEFFALYKGPAENDQCEHPQATVNHQGIYTCPDCWHRVPTPSDSL